MQDAHGESAPNKKTHWWENLSDQSSTPGTAPGAGPAPVPALVSRGSGPSGSVPSGSGPGGSGQSPYGSQPRRWWEYLLVAAVAVLVGGATAGVVTVVLDEDTEQVTADSGTTQSAAEGQEAGDAVGSRAAADASEGSTAGDGDENGAANIDVAYIYEEIRKSVVGIQVQNNRGAQFSGSGFVLSSAGAIATNAHVIGGRSIDDFDPDNVNIVVHLDDGRDLEAKVVGIDFGRDLAVIEVDADDLVPVKIGDVDKLRIGDQVVAVGNALNLGETPSVTLGIVSALDRSVAITNALLTRTIQTDAAINPGNSGGPLLDRYGAVIGITTAVTGDSAQQQVASSFGFAVRIDKALNVIDILRETGEAPEQSFLGVSITSSDNWEAALERDEAEGGQLSELSVDTSVSGAVVTRIFEDTGAERAGIEPGDVIVEVDGLKIGDNENVRDAVRSLLPGETTTVTVVRVGADGESSTLSIKATLGVRPPAEES